MVKRYIVLGGPVRSQRDNDLHYVDASRLAALYGLNPAECYLVEQGTVSWLRMPKDLPVLGPRYDGHYELENTNV